MLFILFCVLYFVYVLVADFPSPVWLFTGKCHFICGARRIAQILNMRYWPNVRWLDVGQEFCVLINQDEVVVIKYAENLGRYTASCPNKLYGKRNYYMAEKITFSAGSTREIPSGQHGPILSTRVANQNAGVALFSRSQTQPHNSRCRDYMI